MEKYRSLSDPIKEEISEDDLIVEPIEINQDCIKCGWHQAAFKYQGRRVEELMHLNGQAFTMLDEDAPQAIILECKRCEYRWIEKPLDEVSAEHQNLDDPKRHNISGSMNKPAGSFRTPIEKD